MFVIEGNKVSNLNYLIDQSKTNKNLKDQNKT